jgi:streptogramin lyase
MRDRHSPKAWQIAFCFALVVALCWPKMAAAQTFTVYALPSANSDPQGIAAGPDGALWFTEFVPGQNTTPNSNGKIGRITTDGVITEFPLPSPSMSPGAITAGPDGAMWFSEVNNTGNSSTIAYRIGRITMSGEFTEFPISGPPGMDGAGAITAGSDGALWFVQGFDFNAFNAVIGRITTDGVMSSVTIPNTQPPNGITTGPDGALWITEVAVAGTDAPSIVRLTPSGDIIQYAAFKSSNNRGYFGITTGADGALWYVGGFALHKITTGGTLSEFNMQVSDGGIAAGQDGAVWFFGADANNKPVMWRATGSETLTAFPVPFTPGLQGSQGLAPGPDGSIWFADPMNHQIGRFAVPPTTSPLVAAVLPSGRAVQVGVTATAFATIINAGTSPLSGCRITPVTIVPATFLYQTTNPASNGLTGTANTPVSMAGGGSQSFFIALTTNAPFVPIDTVLGFNCASTDAAESVSALNTLLLSASTTPVPDIVALAATPSNDGIIDIPGATGSDAFAVASVNVGVSAMITVSADTGSATLPAQITLCQTNPSTGVCLTAPSATVATTIAANATPTFSIFVTGTANIPFDPANSRIFVRFMDYSGNTRGATSVAVRTQQ